VSSQPDAARVKPGRIGVVYGLGERGASMRRCGNETCRPVTCHVDVAVVGGGVSGIFSALAAARHGARTLLIDRFGCLGGNIGPGMIVGGSLFEPLESTLGVGIPRLVDEFRANIESLGGRDDANYVRTAGVVSYVAARMMERAGVSLMLSTYACNPVLEGTNVCGLYVDNNSGRQMVRSKVVIDATGEARIAARAGAPIVRQVPPNPNWSPAMTGLRLDDRYPLCNSVGVYSLIGEVNWGEFAAWRERTEKGTDGTAWVADQLGMGSGSWPTFLVSAMKIALNSGGQEAIRNLLSPDLGSGIEVVGFPRKVPLRLSDRLAGIDTCLRGAIDSGDGAQVSALEVGIRRYVFDSVEFFRRYVPGFQNAFLLNTSPYLGSRGGPFIDGRYVLTIEDLQQGRRFDDVMYVYYREANFKGCGPPEGCDIPYRILLPQTVDGLMATGTSAAYIRRGHDPSVRVRANLFALGCATGVAAALAATDGVPPAELDVRQLQRRLLSEGFYLGSQDRLAALGLTPG